MIDPSRWQELSPLLDEALELGDEQQAAWLEAMSTARPDVAGDLQELLASSRRSSKRQFLETDAVSELNREPLEGATFGAYTLEAPLGRGGMGSVWLARRHDGHFEGKRRHQAAELRAAEPDWRRALPAEGRMLAKLAHPNIARILDAGVADGQQYLVLEYVEGVSIDRYCDEREPR